MTFLGMVQCFLEFFTSFTAGFTGAMGACIIFYFAIKGYKDGIIEKIAELEIANEGIRINIANLIEHLDCYMSLYNTADKIGESKQKIKTKKHPKISDFATLQLQIINTLKENPGEYGATEIMRLMGREGKTARSGISHAIATLVKKKAVKSRYPGKYYIGKTIDDIEADEPRKKRGRQKGWRKAKVELQP